MAAIDTQVHSKFKLFTGALAPDGNVGAVAADVAAWAKSANVAPKSIGVEYVEAAARLILTIGYRDDEPGYGVSLSSARIGSVAELGPAAVAQLERGMAETAAKHQKLICHDLYVTDKNDLVMVFMTHE